MPLNPEPLRTLLRIPALASLRAQLDLQARLLESVRQGLPESLSVHCRHCIGQNETLLIYVDSAAFGAQARFYGPGLLAHLERSAGYRFRAIKVRNLPPSAMPRAPDSRFRPPDRSVGEAMRASAEYVGSEQIRKALLRLGRTLEKIAR